jgi:predicted DNA-binding transcriptional regulator YafY
LPEAVTLPSFIRSISPEILRKILLAQRNKEKLCISYQSPRRPDKTKRWVYPLAFVFTTGRWHLRTYCHLREEFRSFVLGRILSIDAILPEEGDVPPDEDWNSYVTVKIVPSDRLCECAKTIIEQDYKMEQGVAEVSVRKALLKYFLLENRLLETEFAELDNESKLIQDNGMIAVKNVDEIISMISKS